MKHNLSHMMALDIYLSSLPKREYDELSQKIKTETQSLPLLSWDVFSESYRKDVLSSKRLQDILKVKSIAEKWHWVNNIDAIFDQQEFEAIIITDAQQNIIWVNEGFTTMTGYGKLEALNKTPRFLQGKETSFEAKSRIKEKLISNEPFTEVITNYKKDGSLYKCEVKIIPLYTKETTHFIALERQVS